MPRLTFDTLADLNTWLADRCRILAAGTRHPEDRERTVAAVFAEERPRLLSVSVPFDGCKELPVRNLHHRAGGLRCQPLQRPGHRRGTSGAAACLRRADRGGAGRRPHRRARRAFGRGQVVYDPWHYLPVLQRKPGALRNGAPFRDWDLPASLTALRTALGRHADGDRQFVGILGAVPTYGLDAVEAACAEALAMRAPSRTVVLSLLSRLHETPPIPPADLPPHLPTLQTPPLADCRRYEVLLTGGHHA